MFKLFGGNKAKVRKLRADFEDIRQRMLFQMIPYEQYCFGGVFDNLPDEITEAMENIREHDFNSWRKVGENALEISKIGYEHYSSIGGISGEGGRAGAQGFALLAFELLAKSYELPETGVLCAEIRRSRQAVQAFVTSDNYEHQRLPKYI